ncbi:Syntaxin-16 [Acipenser ruthenus]|uniref:Syntaxin-16 n=1 Tax=Acipenser ruthenus TaxID=7906 RepID=A0A444UUI6_ACIRT|nr:Syntaxin-16 [Acipenser ruthenus]
MALVSGISLDPEAAIGVTKRLPPKWVDGVDEIQYDVTRIKQKMKELASLHDKHMNRPTLDDSSEAEHAIEITTQEITQMFHRCQRAVTGIQSRSRHCTEQEERLLRNVVSSLAQSLQDLSINFRHTQSNYLKPWALGLKGINIQRLQCLGPAWLKRKVPQHVTVQADRQDLGAPKKIVITFRDGQRVNC